MTASLATFDSTKQSLKDILNSIQLGRIQLPDFQRGWVWDDDHIKSLLASISLSYPIGSVMLLETGNELVRFKPRPIEGVPLNGSVRPDSLILDGQQRLTSLFQALFSEKVVETRDARKKQIKRWYYLDIRKALNPAADREEAIIGLPEDRMLRNFRGEIIKDYSTPSAEYEASLFPLAAVFDSSNWRMGYYEHWRYERERVQLFNEFERDVIKRFEQYLLPLIYLLKETPKEAVCQVFEKVNTSGVSLTVFELLTATFASDNFDLREDWGHRERDLRKHTVLSNVQNDDFLQAIALLTTYTRRQAAIAKGDTIENAPGVSCKRKDILALTHQDYRAWADKVTAGFKRAARLLMSQRVFEARDVPYRTQLVPLASVLALLGNEADRDSVRSKLVRWYWCGVFGELYGSAVESRFARDVPEILEWIPGGDEPTTVSEAHFVAGRLLTLKTRNSAAYKGLSALLMRDGGLDFHTGEPIEIQLYDDGKVDIHHIFPAAWCDRNGIDQHRRDSIINKSPLSARTNRRISDNAPSEYLPRIERDAGIDTERLNDILHSHVIEPDYLRVDNFDGFFQARRDALLDRIEAAMGKPVSRGQDLESELPEQYEIEEGK